MRRAAIGCHGSDIKRRFRAGIHRIALKGWAQHREKAGRAHRHGNPCAAFTPAGLCNRQRHIGLDGQRGIRRARQGKCHHAAPFAVQWRDFLRDQIRREAFILQAKAPAAPGFKGLRVWQQADFRIARKPRPWRAVEEARGDGQVERRSPRHQRPRRRPGGDFQPFGHKGIHAELRATNRRQSRISQRFNGPLAKDSAIRKLQRPGNRATRKAWRRDFRRDLPIGPAQPKPQRQILRIAPGIAQKPSQIHHLTWTINAAIQPEKRIKRAGMRTACRAAIRKIETRRFKIERGEVIRRFGMNSEGRERPLPTQQCDWKTRKPRFIRARFRQHIIIARHQRHAQPGFHLARMKAARLHRQPIGTAPGGECDIRHEKRKGRGRRFPAPAFRLPCRDEVKPRRGITQQISQRQRMAR